MKGSLVELRDELGKFPLSLVLVSQKRFLTAFMAEAWRKPFKEKFPDLPIFEVRAILLVFYLRVSRSLSFESRFYHEIILRARIHR